MIDRLHHRGWHYLLLISIGGLMFFLNLGGATLWDLDEGCNSGCAWEMMEAGNWIVPTFNSQLRVDKPVLLYWLQIFSYLGFGVNEFAARLPSALAALATVLLAYELARSMFKRTTGLLAGVIVATTPMLCGAARFANPDSLLNCCTVLTMTVFWLGVARRRWWWFALLGLASGLAVLAKGPVGLILPGVVITLFLLWERKLNLVWNRRWFVTFWSFVLTAFPWYIWVGIETKGEFLSGFLWKHNIERATSALDNHRGFPGYFLVVLFVGTAPWSIFLVVACWFGFWSSIRCPWSQAQKWWSRASEVGRAAIAPDASGPRSREGEAPAEPLCRGNLVVLAARPEPRPPVEGRGEMSLTDKPSAYRLLTCWILVYVVFFSIARTKLPAYILPAVVPCTLLIARFLQRWRIESVRLPGWLVHGSVVSLSLIGLLFSLALAIAGGVGELPMLRGHYFPGLETWALVGLIPIAAAAACSWFARARQYGRFITAVAVCAILLLGPMAAFGSVLFNQCKAPRRLVEQSDALRPADDIRIGCWHVEHLPSLNFYLKRNVEHFRDENALANFLVSRLPVYLFIPLEDWRRIEGNMAASTRIIGRQYDMYHHTEVVVVTNR